MSKSICLAQNVEEIIYILRNVKKEVIIVPLDLSTQLYCINKKLKYYNPLNFIDKTFHQETLVNSEKLIRGLKFGDLVDESHQKELKAIVRFRFHSIAFIIEIIEKLKLSKNIDEVIVSGFDRYFDTFSKKNIFVSNLVLNLISDIKVTSLNKILKKKNFSNKQYNFKIYNHNKDDNNEYILLTNLGYNFFRIVMTLKKKKVKMIVPLIGKIGFFKRIIYKFLNVKIVEFKKIDIDKISDIRLPVVNFTYKGKDLSKELNSRLAQETNNFVNLKNQSKAIENFFKKIKVKFVITNLSRGISGYFIDLAKKLNIISICIPHGTLAQNFDEHDKIYKETISEAITSNNAQFHTSQSIIAKKFFEEKKENFKNILNSGNLIFCGNHKKNRKNKKKILFAVTMKDFQSIQLLGVEMYYEFLDNLYFLEKIAKKYQLNFLIKLHPSTYENYENLKIIFKNLEFSKKKINKVLDESYVTLSFSSTVIEDSLSSECPVILLDRWKRYKHCEAEENSKIKNSAVYYVTNEYELIDCLKTISLSEKIDFTKYNFNKTYKYNLVNTLNNFI